MRIIIAIAILSFFAFIPAYAEEADGRVYVTGKTLKNRETDVRYSELPPYLHYLNDTIHERQNFQECCYVLYRAE